MMRVFKKFLADESGATAIEYGLIAAGIALAIIAMTSSRFKKLGVEVHAGSGRFVRVAASCVKRRKSLDASASSG